MRRPTKSKRPAQDFSDRLLAWYRCHARTLPWRIPPSPAPTDSHKDTRKDSSHESPTSAPDPYRVWLAEIMLQQTTVASVIQYYQKFQARWPTVGALAAADDAEVLAAWAGLGYYARARNMLACARQVVRDYDGKFPDSEEGLRTLSGIGDYSAAAIAAIAFDRRACVIDANVTRVIARHRAISAVPTRAMIRNALEPMIPERRCGDFAQAMMDLGARICTAPKANKLPRCDLCPIAADCLARERDLTTKLPMQPTKKAKPTRYGIVHYISNAGRIWLVRRPAQGLLGGMRALPDDDWDKRADSPHAIAIVRHSFTHFHLRLSVVRTTAPRAKQAGEWWSIDTIETAGLPTLYRKVVTAMQAMETPS